MFFCSHSTQSLGEFDAARRDVPVDTRNVGTAPVALRASLFDDLLSTRRFKAFADELLPGNNNDISYCYYRQITIYRYKYVKQKEVIEND